MKSSIIWKRNVEAEESGNLWTLLTKVNLDKKDCCVIVSSLGYSSKHWLKVRRDATNDSRFSQYKVNFGLNDRISVDHNIGVS